MYKERQTSAVYSSGFRNTWNRRTLDLVLTREVGRGCVATEPQIPVSLRSLSLWFCATCPAFLLARDHNISDNAPSQVWNPSASIEYSTNMRREDHIPPYFHLLSLSPFSLSPRLPFHFLFLRLHFSTVADSFIAFLAREEAASRRKDCGFAEESWLY